MEVGLTSFDDRNGEFACDYCNHLQLVGCHLNLRAWVGDKEFGSVVLNQCGFHGSNLENWIRAVMSR